MALAKQRRTTDTQPTGPRPGPAVPQRTDAGPTRADALRRIAAKVSGRRDLDGLFEDVIDEAFPLFGVDRAGLWLLRRARRRRCGSAAQRGLSAEILETIATLPRDAPTAGMRRSATARSGSSTGPCARTTPRLRGDLPRLGIRTVCFVPLVFGDEPARPARPLPPQRLRAGRPTRRALARAFGDHMATAIGNARLADVATNARRPAARRSPSSPAGSATSRTSRASPRRSSPRPAASSTTTRSGSIGSTTRPAGASRSPSRDVPGQPAPPLPDSCACAIGEGLTGWVAEHGAAGPAGRRAHATRAASSSARPTSPSRCSLVPMMYEGTVHGVLVVSALGARPVRRRRRDDPDDLRRLRRPRPSSTATNMRAPARQQVELEHQLEGQRRLLEVNERLLSTLDPAGVLDLIADSLKAIVPYDSLTIYRVDRDGRRAPRRHRPRPVRRRDPRPREPARDRDHGLGHRPRRGGAAPTRRTSIRARSRCRARRSSRSR